MIKALFLSSFLLFAPFFALAKTLGSSSITLYTYHKKPPYYFQLNDETEWRGLYPDLVALIRNQHPEIDVTLDYLPRGRMNALLENEALSGGIIGVNPIWFADRDKTIHQWTAVFMVDRDDIVVSKDYELDYSHPRDLQGLRLALVRGLYYWGVSEQIANNEIQAFYTDTEYQNLLMIVSGRVDASITGSLTYRYYQQESELRGLLKTLSEPHDSFERLILFPRNAKLSEETLSKVNETLGSDAWQKILTGYLENPHYRHTQAN